MNDIDKLKREICAMQPVPSMVDRLIQTVEAAHTAKLRQGVELPEPTVLGEYYDGTDIKGYEYSQLEQYAAAAAAQAREKALEQCLIKVTGLSVDVERCKQLQLTTQAWEEALDAAADAIEKLKERP